MRRISHKNLFFSAAIAPLALMISGCSLASLPKNYSPIEKQTVAELSGSNYTPRSDEEREAIATQDMFAQTAFWSREYDLNPADLEAAINLAANLRKMGNASKSIEVAQHTRALYPRDVDLMTELAASLIANNETNEALKIIDTALYQRPRSARLWSLKGAAMDQMERFGEARQYYTKALGFAPNDPSILANVGLSYALEGDPQTAEIWLQRAVTLPGATANARQNLALVLGLQGKLDEAEKWAKQDLNQEGAEQNLAYIRSLRGTSVPSTPKPQPTARLLPATDKSPSPQIFAQTSTSPKTRYSSKAGSTGLAGVKSNLRPAKPATGGAKITIAGDPNQKPGGPQTVSEAALEVLRQRNTALRNMPSTAKPAAATPPQTSVQKTNPVLDKISQNNVPKAAIAQRQQAHLAQRAAHAAQQRQLRANPRYPQQHVQHLPNGQILVNGRSVPMQQQPFAVSQPNYADTRPPARTRRR